MTALSFQIDVLAEMLAEQYADELEADGFEADFMGTALDMWQSRMKHETTAKQVYDRHFKA